MNATEKLIDDWRNSALDGHSNEDELTIRRILAEGDAEVAAVPSDKQPVSTGRFNREFMRIANLSGLFNQLTKREVVKENAQLRDLVAALETRIRKLEAKTYPLGAGS